MNASLRLRLALLVVCSVALTVALVLYLTWQRQKKQWDPHTVIASLLTGIVVCLAVLILRVF